MSLPAFPSLQSFKELVVQSGVRLTGAKVFLAAAVPAAAIFPFSADLPRGPVFLQSRLRARSRPLRSICSCIGPRAPDRRIQRAVPRRIGRDRARLARRTSFQGRDRPRCP